MKKGNLKFFSAEYYPVFSDECKYVVNVCAFDIDDARKMCLKKFKETISCGWEIKEVHMKRGIYR